MKIFRMLIAGCLFAGPACFAQVPGRAFEAASIRANPDRGEPQVEVTSGSLTARREPLIFLLQWAYDLPLVQIESPSWMMENRFESRFDIVAKASGPADEGQLRLMLQTLLADRFGVKTHRDKRVMQVYAMTLAKGGPKFQESTTEGSFTLAPNPVILTAHHARMADLAQAIAVPLGRPVVDATGLNGRYEIRMDMSPYMVKPAGSNAGDGQPDVVSLLFTGFQEILGLRLESRRDSVEMLVIDHAEKAPTEN